MRRIANAYRLLVAAQTAGWAVAAFRRVAVHARASENAPVVLIVVVFVLVFTAVAIAWRRRGGASVVIAWVLLQLGGAAMLAAYVTTGQLACFIPGLATLAVMHVVSPNRYGL